MTLALVGINLSPVRQSITLTYISIYALSIYVLYASQFAQQAVINLSRQDLLVSCMTWGPDR